MTLGSSRIGKAIVIAYMKPGTSSCCTVISARAGSTFKMTPLRG